MHRIKLGLPDSSRDLIIEKSTLLEYCFDEMNGIDWEKGCYMGQEVTARTKYRGLLKKRLLPVKIEGQAPEAGTVIKLDEFNAGEMRSSTHNIGLALLKLEYLDANFNPKDTLRADNSIIVPRHPFWIKHTS